MKSTQFDSNGSRQTFTLDVSDLPSGAYLYQITGNGYSVKSGKFLVIK